MSAMRFARSLLGLDDRAEAPVSPGAAGRRNMLLLIQLRWLAVIGQVVTIAVVTGDSRYLCRWACCCWPRPGWR